jgi:hypothetical protein
MLGQKMKEEDKKKIQEIMSVLKCEKNFKCADSGFEILCKTKKFGLDGYLICLEIELEVCSFGLSFGHGYLCKCPVRVYLAERLQK